MKEITLKDDDIIKQFGEDIIIDVTSIKNNKKVRLV